VVSEPSNFAIFVPNNTRTKTTTPHCQLRKTLYTNREEESYMKESIFKYAMLGIAIAFTLLFSIVVMPPLIENPDIIGALAAGFVNPYSSGYSADVLFCWAALAVWVLYDAKTLSVKHGWVCLLLGAFPGVAVGFPLYLILRNGQITQVGKNA